MNREIPYSKFIAAFLMTVIIFMIIFMTNSYLNEAKLNQITNMYNEIRIDSLNAEVQYQILSENPCLALNFEPMTNELFDLGSKLTDMEDSLGKSNKQVLDLKKYYSILEVSQWLFVKKASMQCHKTVTPILFFYSNAGDCDDCDSQGFVLDYLRKSKQGVYVYSFDVNLDASAIQALKANYNITSVPALVIGEKPYFGYKDSDKLLELVK